MSTCVDMAAQAIKLSWDIANKFRDVPKKRGKCKDLIDQVCRLARVLQQLHSSRTQATPLTPQAKACFEDLRKCLEDAYRLLEKTSKASTLRYIFMSTEVAEDMCLVSGNIDACLRSLPLIQFTQQAALQDEVKDLRASFANLSLELKKKSTYSEEQQDLAAEVSVILRSRNAEDGQEKTLDKLLSWLARKFGSDMETVRKEWEDMKKMKEDAFDLTNLERTSSSKKRIEEELLEQIIFCIDDLDSGKLQDVDVSGIPGEFLCSICHEGMRRAVILPSGHSYCKNCIQNCFSDGQVICPNTRAVFSSDSLIDNIGLRNAIARYMQANQAPPVYKPLEIVSKTYEPEFVQQKVLELKSFVETEPESHIKVLKVLNCLLEIVSSSNGIVTIFQCGGTTYLEKLLRSPKRIVVEKAIAILALMTSAQGSMNADDTGQNVDEIFEQCWDMLVVLVTTGTGMVRLKAAETLTNLLSIPEATDYLLSQVGIISSLVTLASESDDGMEICLRGLQKLSRNIDANLSGASSLTACLFDLLKSEEDGVVEESILALKSVVASGGPRACKVLKMKNAANFLVRRITSFYGTSQEAAIMILELYAKSEGFSDIAEAGSFELFLSLVAVPQSSEGSLLLQAILRLSAGCLDFQKEPSVEPGHLQKVTARLMEVIQIKDHTADALHLLKLLCTKENACKEFVLDNNGLTILQALAQSPRSGSRKGALSLVRILLQSGSCQKEFSEAGGIDLLGNTIQTDESVECITEAVISLDLIAGNPKLKDKVLASLDVGRLLRCMAVEFTEQCRESAASLALLLLVENSDILASRRTLKQLSSIVQQLTRVLQHGESSMAMKRKVAEILLLFATSGQDIDMDNTIRILFIELADGAEENYKDLLLSFVSRCHPTITEEIPLLHDAFLRSECRKDAAASIRRLVETVVSSRSMLLKAGFGLTGIEALKSGCCDESCVDDISASLVLVYSCCSQDVESARRGYIDALVKLLMENSSVTSAAVSMLTSFISFEKDCLQSLLRFPDPIKALLSALRLETRAKALELLSTATKNSSARRELYKQGGIPKLIECLSVENDRVQELASDILLEFGMPDEDIDYPQNVGSTMISNGIIDKLLTILQKTSESSHTAVLNCACLIRNLVRSLSSGTEDVLRILLKVFKFYLQNNGYVERMKYVILALEKMTVPVDPRLKSLLRDNMALILKPLREDYTQGDSDDMIRMCALSILASLLLEESLCKDLRVMLLNASYVSAIKKIMQTSTNNECKSRAASLFVRLIESGPRQKEVCQVLREQDCIRPLFALRHIPECSRQATRLLELLKQDKGARAFIEQNYFPWERTSSAPASRSG